MKNFQHLHDVGQLLTILEQTAPESHDRVDVHNRISWVSRALDPKISLEHAHLALDMSERLRYGYGLAHAKLEVAFYAYYREGKFVESMKMINQAKSIFHQEKYPVGAAYCDIIMGMIYWYAGDYESGFRLFNEGIKVHEATQNVEGEAWASYLMGSSYYDLQDFQAARKYYERAVILFEQVGDMIGATASVTSLGAVANVLGDTELAIHYLGKALDSSIRLGFVQTEARVYDELGVVSQRLKKYEEAIAYYIKGLELREQLQNVQGNITSQYHMGSILYEMQEYEEAEKFYKKAAELAERAAARPKLMRTYGAMAQLYKAWDKPWQALEYYEKQAEAKSNLSEESNLQLKNLKSIYQVEKAEQEAEIQRLRNVELRSAYDQIEAQTNNILDSINYARRIQEALLPPFSQFQKAFADAFVLYHPRDIVSGDFYWFAQHDQKVFVAAIDCTGHGVPGAFMTVMANSLLDEIINMQEVEDPAQVLLELDTKVRRHLHQGHAEDTGSQDGMDIALLQIDLQSREIIFAGAKSPLYLVRNGHLNEIKGSKFPIGSTQFGTLKVFDAHAMQGEAGDCLYLSTDGYRDQFGGPDSKKFQSRRLRELLIEDQTAPMTTQLQKLEEAFFSWKNGEKQTDDVLVIGLRLA